MIGIVGGIGAGKSAVARVLGELGCLVMDSDADAREAFEREDVRAALVSWWGEGVLATGGGGAIDRSKVAAVIFADGAQRQRLERLIHPLIHAKRRRRIEAAGSMVPVPRGIVIDAPLLFEAGVDKECDAVVFVDAPLEQRLERVRGRGWNASELARREVAQMPIEEKRARSSHVVRNAGSMDELRAQVEGVLNEVCGRELPTRRDRQV